LPNKQTIKKYEEGYFQQSQFLEDFCRILNNPEQIEDKILNCNISSFPLLLDKKLIFDVYKNEKTKLESNIARIKKKLPSMQRSSQTYHDKLLQKVQMKKFEVQRLDHIQEMIFKSLPELVKDFMKGCKKYSTRFFNSHLPSKTSESKNFSQNKSCKSFNSPQRRRHSSNFPLLQRGHPFFAKGLNRNAYEGSVHCSKQ
jgi:hypothetical protein